MKPESMNIAVSVSKYYLPYTYVMLHSLLKNNACPINVYILHRELCPADFDFLRTLTHTHPLVINDCRLSEDQIPLSADDSAAPAAPESLFYLSIPRILPADLTRILYLDSDVIGQCLPVRAVCSRFDASYARCLPDSVRHCRRGAAFQSGL